MSLLIDIDTMARTIWGEARNQSYNGQVAVGYVIKNRSIDRGISIANVCKQPLQFSCWNENDPNRPKMLAQTLETSPTFLEAYGISCLVIGGSVNDPTFGANHYFTTNNVLNLKTWPPIWAGRMQRVAVIGDHTFLKG